MAEKKENDVLDHIKKAEKVIKTNLLIKQLGELKKIAREVLELKEKSTMILEDIGIEADDIKRVIDFINSSPEVQLSETDKKDLREKVKRDAKSKRHDVQRELEEHPFYGNFGSNAFTLTSATAGGSNLAYAVNTATAGTSGITLSNASNNDSITIPV